MIEVITVFCIVLLVTGTTAELQTTYRTKKIKNLPLKDADSNLIVDYVKNYEILEGSAITINNAAGLPYSTSDTHIYSITKAVKDTTNNTFNLLVEGTAGALEDKFSVWSTNSAGLITNKTSWLTGSEMTALSHEPTFSVDFNSNGSIA